MNKITKELVVNLEEKLNYEKDRVYISDKGALITVNNNIIVNYNGDVNFMFWHGDSIKHKGFKFNLLGAQYLETDEQVYEFGQLVLRYFLIDLGEKPKII